MTNSSNVTHSGPARPHVASMCCRIGRIKISWRSASHEYRTTFLTNSMNSFFGINLPNFPIRCGGAGETKFVVVPSTFANIIANRSLDNFSKRSNKFFNLTLSLPHSKTKEGSKSDATEGSCCCCCEEDEKYKGDPYFSWICCFLIIAKYAEGDDEEEGDIMLF